MIILDTDTLSIAQHPNNPAALVLRRHLLQLAPDEFVGTTIISYEEQTRGWLSYVSKARTSSARLEAYSRLHKHLAEWRKANVLPFDDLAESRYAHLLSLKLHLGSSDLKIAAITLSKNALLVTRNRKDFQRVPGLQIEDWTIE